MSDIDHSCVSTRWGEAEWFYDVTFTSQQCAYAGVETEDKNGISVRVDEITGRVELNNGYAPGSTIYDDEQRLFENFEDAIVESLIGTITSSSAIHSVFMIRAAADAERRRAALRDLDAEIYVHDLSAEDVEDEVA
jgi:phage tail tape-measure protein